MFKYIAKKILGKPQIINDEQFADIHRRKWVMVLDKLRYAYVMKNERQISLLKRWCRNNGLNPPDNGKDCILEMTRIEHVRRI